RASLRYPSCLNQRQRIEVPTRVTDRMTAPAHVSNHGALVPITGAEVTATLDMRTCIDLMRVALASLGSGEARQLLRPVLPLHGRNVVGMMPAYDPNANVAGAKVLSVFPDNYLRGRASHQGVILLFDA